jgi:hypothetical protein
MQVPSLLGGTDEAQKADAFDDWQGFWIENHVLSDRECYDLIEILSLNQRGRSRAGARHLMSIPAVEAIANDERLLRIAGRALGAGATPFRATLFDKSVQANWLVVWHQDRALPLASRSDSPEWGPWSVKAGVLYAHAPAWALSRILALRIHLDASTNENGPLRVIPGTHLAGVLSENEILELARRKEMDECVVRRGGVLAMRPLIVHSSSKARSGDPRRVLHLEYADAIELGTGLRLAIV